MKNKIFFFCYIIVILFQINIAKVYAEESSVYQINGSIFKYNEDNNIIEVVGNVVATDKNGKKISADKIIYDKKNSIIKTYLNSVFQDTNGNKIIAKNFVYHILDKSIQAEQDVQYTDKNGNKFYFSKLKYFEESQKGVGIDFAGVLSDNSHVEGFEAEFDNISGTLTIGSKKNNNWKKFLNLFDFKPNTYTSCKFDFEINSNIKEKCPDWSINTNKTTHDKNKKMVYHYGAVINVKNVPIFYLPYFSHPDPSINRKSGVLPPTLKNFSELGQTLKIPYFWAIDNNSDLTFTPIYYFEENPIFLLEYRKQGEKNKFFIDTSYTQGYEKLDKTDSDGNLLSRTPGSRNHFFFNFFGNYDNLIFERNDLEVNIERVSQKNYLNINQINTNFVKQNVSSLKNYILLNSYEGSKKMSIKSSVYEDLNFQDKNSKYQYTLPSIEYYNFFNEFNQNISYKTSFKSENQGGDSSRLFLLNKIETKSEPFLSTKIDGLSNTVKMSVNNLNFYNQNMLNEKENFSSDLFITTALESSLPLIKIQKNNEQTITPKILIKYTTGSMSDINQNNKILSYNDIFSINRTDSENNIDTGASLGYGIEYETLFKNDMNTYDTKASLSLGQIINFKKNQNMPQTSTLVDKNSAFVGSANLEQNIGDGRAKIKYDYILSNNLNKFLKSSINSEFQIGNNELTINYYDLNEIGNERYIDSRYIKKFNNDINVLLGIRKNLKDDFTESNFIETNYESDCIKIALNLSKVFYQNEELRPSNNLTLSLTLKPFGSPASQNLSNFLN